MVGLNGVEYMDSSLDKQRLTRRVATHHIHRRAKRHLLQTGLYERHYPIVLWSSSARAQAVST